MLQIHKGRPQDAHLRQLREQKVYDFLDSLGLEYDRIDHQPAMTMEICQAIDAAFGRMSLTEFQASSAQGHNDHAIICKNLFLTNKQKTRFYLLLMPADKKFLTKNLSAQINSARLSFAGEQEMLEFLDVTPGSASVLALLNDKNNNVQLLIDSDVLRSEFVGCHPCINTSSLRMKTSDLIERIIPALKHQPIIVNL